MSFVRAPLQIVRGASPLVLTAVAVAIVIVFLFANPLVSAGLGLAVPLLMVVLVSGFAIGMNARMSMWHGRRPFWFGIADWGFLGCFAAFAVYGFANVESSAQMIAYVFVGVLFIAACRFAFMEFEAWWLGLAFAAIMLLITGQYLLFTLPHPEWFFDFLPSLLILTSLALIVTGSVVSHIHTGQVDATDEGPSLGIPAMRGVAGVVIALAALSAGITVMSRTSAEAGDSIALAWGGAYDVEGAGQLQAGENRLLLQNDDLTVHTFTWLRQERVNCIVNRAQQEICETETQATGYDFTVGPGSERLVNISLQAGVQYLLVCSVPGHSEEEGLRVGN